MSDERKVVLFRDMPIRGVDRDAADRYEGFLAGERETVHEAVAADRARIRKELLEAVRGWHENGWGTSESADAMRSIIDRVIPGEP